MTIRGVRALALQLVVVLGLTFVVGGTASAAALAAPSVSLRQLGASMVSISGRTATAAPRVRVERATGTGWQVVRRLRAHRHQYVTSVWMAAGTSATFRVVGNHRSRTFVVRMPAATTSTTPTTATTAAATLYDACGARPLKADGSAWSCTFDDEFSGTALDRTKWVPQTNFLTGDPTAGYACYVDDPDNISVGGGMLSLTVRKEATALPCGSPTSSVTSPYTAGSITTYHLFSQQYGRFEARIRNTASAAPGLHEAFWLWPDDRVASTVTWPDAGEIDISETYSLYNLLTIPFLHYSADSSGPLPGVNTAWNCAVQRGQWNTYTLEWTPSRLTISVNGATCLTNTSGDPAFMKPYIVMLTEALGQGANALTDATPIPATMNVDYVRVWN